MPGQTARHLIRVTAPTYSASVEWLVFAETHEQAARQALTQWAQLKPPVFPPASTLQFEDKFRHRCMRCGNSEQLLGRPDFLPCDRVMCGGTLVPQDEPLDTALLMSFVEKYLTFQRHKRYLVAGALKDEKVQRALAKSASEEQLTRILMAGDSEIRMLLVREVIPKIG